MENLKMTKKDLYIFDSIYAVALDGLRLLEHFPKDNLVQTVFRERVVTCISILKFLIETHSKKS